MTIDPIILKAAIHRDGKLSPETAADIQIYLVFPNTQNWHIIHSLVIIGNTTLWQAVLRVDENFTQTGRKYRELNEDEIKKAPLKTKRIGDAKLRYKSITAMTEDWSEIPEPETVLKAIEAETKRNRGIIK